MATDITWSQCNNKAGGGTLIPKRHVANDVPLRCLVIAHIPALRASLRDVEGSRFLRTWHKAEMQISRDPRAIALENAFLAPQVRCRRRRV